jgi:hypothetical protein
VLLSVCIACLQRCCKPSNGAWVMPSQPVRVLLAELATAVLLVHFGCMPWLSVLFICHRVCGTQPFQCCWRFVVCLYLMRFCCACMLRWQRCKPPMSYFKACHAKVGLAQALEISSTGSRLLDNIAVRLPVAVLQSLLAGRCWHWQGLKDCVLNFERLCPQLKKVIGRQSV